MSQIDTLARLLLAELRAEQARIDAVAATRRRSKESPPVRYTPLAGPAEAFGKQLLAVARGGGGTFEPGFTAALQDFEVKHG